MWSSDCTKGDGSCEAGTTGALAGLPDRFDAPAHAQWDKYSVLTHKTEPPPPVPHASPIPSFCHTPASQALPTLLPWACCAICQFLWREGGGHSTPHSAQPQHTNDGAPQTRKRHQQEHGHSGRQNAATRRNMRRDEGVTVQGPVKNQRPDEMSHRGGGVRHWVTVPPRGGVGAVTGWELPWRGHPVSCYRPRLSPCCVFWRDCPGVGGGVSFLNPHPHSSPLPHTARWPPQNTARNFQPPNLLPLYAPTPTPAPPPKRLSSGLTCPQPFAAAFSLLPWHIALATPHL